MDQAASEDQILLWNLGQCREDSSLDRHQYLPADCDHQEKAGYFRNQSPHFSTHFEVNLFEQRLIKHIVMDALQQKLEPPNSNQLDLFTF